MLFIILILLTFFPFNQGDAKLNIKFLSLGNNIFGFDKVINCPPTYDTSDSDLLQHKIDAGGDVSLGNKTYFVTKPLIISNNNVSINGNNATIIYKYSQKLNSYNESLFVIKNVDEIKIQNISLVYDGKFDLGAYSGYICGIYAYGCSNLVIDNVSASGFNRAGINISGNDINTPYCDNVLVSNCHLNNNRVAGCIFGNTKYGKFLNNTVTKNGVDNESETGYGFAGWSACNPIKTTVSGNFANYNYRKGIDFHSGTDGVISNNNCKGNLVNGIFAVGVKGNWKIVNNIISDMDASHSNYFDLTGIEIGNDKRNKDRTQAFYFKITDNKIENFGGKIKMDKGIYPIFIHVKNIGRAEIEISKNNFNCLNVTSLVRTTAGNADKSDFYDIKILNNSFKCNSSKSVPIYLRGTNFRSANVTKNILVVKNGNELKYLFLSDKSKYNSNKEILTDNQFLISNFSNQKLLQKFDKSNSMKFAN